MIARAIVMRDRRRCGPKLRTGQAALASRAFANIRTPSDEPELQAPDGSASVLPATRVQEEPNQIECFFDCLRCLLPNVVRRSCGSLCSRHARSPDRAQYGGADWQQPAERI